VYPRAENAPPQSDDHDDHDVIVLVWFVVIFVVVVIVSGRPRWRAVSPGLVDGHQRTGHQSRGSANCSSTCVVL